MPLPAALRVNDRVHPVFTEVSLVGNTERGGVVRAHEASEEGSYYLRPTQDQRRLPGGSCVSAEIEKCPGVGWKEDGGRGKWILLAGVSMRKKLSPIRACQEVVLPGVEWGTAA